MVGHDGINGAVAEVTGPDSREKMIDINGVMMLYAEWKEYMHSCPHEHWTHAGVKLMDGSKMSICDRCKFIQHEAIAKIIEGEAI